MDTEPTTATGDAIERLALRAHAGPNRNAQRREENASNWNRKRTGSRVGVTKPTLAKRKAKRRARKRGS